MFKCFIALPQNFGIAGLIGHWCLKIRIEILCLKYALCLHSVYAFIRYVQCTYSALYIAILHSIYTLNIHINFMFSIYVHTLYPTHTFKVYVECICYIYVNCVHSYVSFSVCAECVQCTYWWIMARRKTSIFMDNAQMSLHLYSTCMFIHCVQCKCSAYTFNIFSVYTKCVRSTYMLNVYVINTWKSQHIHWTQRKNVYAERKRNVYTQLIAWTSMSVASQSVNVLAFIITACVYLMYVIFLLRHVIFTQI